MKKVRTVSGLKNSRKERRKIFYEIVDQKSYGLLDAIREYRYMIGKTQEEFSQFTGVPLRTIREMEQGKANPTLKTLEKMLRGSGLELSVRRKGII